MSAFLYRQQTTFRKISKLWSDYAINILFLVLDWRKQRLECIRLPTIRMWHIYLIRCWMRPNWIRRLNSMKATRTHPSMCVCVTQMHRFNLFTFFPTSDAENCALVHIWSHTYSTMRTKQSLQSHCHYGCRVYFCIASDSRESGTHSQRYIL